ncbi:unnamed protein product [Caenorhabditis angaria]|uniref:F-box domain-containing protein n=1 Tax=Caenorhabditis angaria TaxID=860376 RepID=A0A9P1MY33_9PELO|nr:unnamed protein product [Caenorhabditis angaria]
MHLENLKEIVISCISDDLPFIDKHQLLSIDKIDLAPGINFKSNDLFDFKGKHVSVSIDDFNKDNFKKYLEMLKNGQITVECAEIYEPILQVDFSNIKSEYAINEDDESCSFDFSSEYRKYSVTWHESFLEIETVEIFEKLDQCIYWPQLPLHIQENVIYQMDVKSRCKFAQCSKKSEKEAKRSKNYLYKIGVLDNSEWCSELQFAFSENSDKDFWFEFMDEYSYNNQTIVLYKTWKNGEEFIKWTKIESGKPYEVRLKYLKEYLSKYEKVIKYFHSETILLQEISNNLNNLGNLEKIYIKDDTDESSDYLKLGYLDWKLIRKCKHVFLHRAVLSFEQVLELDIETAEIQCHDMENKNNFKNYLNMLKNGRIHRNLKKIRFNLIKQENMDIREFGTLWRIEENRETLTFRLKSNVIENGIIEVFQQFGDSQCHILIKCYEELEG